MEQLVMLLLIIVAFAAQAYSGTYCDTWLLLLLILLNYILCSSVCLLCQSGSQRLLRIYYSIHVW